MNPSAAISRVSMNKEKHGSAASAAVVLAAVNSSTILNPLIGPLVDPQACASAIANAAHSSFPDVLIQSNQVHTLLYLAFVCVEFRVLLRRYVNI